MARKLIQDRRRRDGAAGSDDLSIPSTVVTLPESEDDRWWSAWIWGWLAAVITLMLWAALTATTRWVLGHGFNILAPWPIGAVGLVLASGVGVLIARRALRRNFSHRAELTEEDMTRALAEISSQMDTRLKESGK